ncbi:MAG: asparaginase domain-containing protein, partial [Candidatus Thermoplasmatota archaeon]|nr:asparaginase domain-containing protein [Candidatus Thermoplasmatota archaeon]
MASGEPEFGDSISVETDSGTYSGIFVHQEPDFIFIKLGSGYNTGISRSRIRKVKLVQKRNVPEETTKVDGRKDGKGIAILSTGGTISSRVDYSTGGVKPSSTMDRLYSEELSRMHTVPVHYSSVSNILSENMTPELWVELARSIKKSLDREEGVVVFHPSAAGVSPALFSGASQSSGKTTPQVSLQYLSAHVCSHHVF